MQFPVHGKFVFSCELLAIDKAENYPRNQPLLVDINERFQCHLSRERR